MTAPKPFKKVVFRDKSVHKESLSDLKEESKDVALKWYDFGSSKLRGELKKNPGNFLALFILTFGATIAISTLCVYLLLNRPELSLSMPNFSFPSVPKIEKMEFFTGSANAEAFKFDPYILLSGIREGREDYVLIDIRTQREYDAGHIKTAVSVPIYDSEFIKEGRLDGNAIKKAIQEKAKDKKLVIIYAHSSASTYPDQVASIIDKSGKRAKVLSIGWNEWAHFKTLWVPESEWDTVELDSFVQIPTEN